MYNPYFNAINSYNSPYNPVSAGMGYSQLNKQEITEVYGMQGAQTYQMPPNSSCMLLDASEPITYIKKTDGAGSASIIAYKLVPLQTDNNDLVNGTTEIHTETDLDFKNCCSNINKSITFVLTDASIAGTVTQLCTGVLKLA